MRHPGRAGVQAKATHAEQPDRADREEGRPGVVGDDAQHGRGRRRPTKPARASGTPRASQARIRRRLTSPTAITATSRTRTGSVFDRRGRSCSPTGAGAARRRPPSSLGPPASNTERLRCASPPSDQVDREQHRQAERPAQRRPAQGSRPPRAPGCAPGTASAATAAPAGNTIAAPTSAPKRPAAKITAEHGARREEGDHGRPRAGSRRPRGAQGGERGPDPDRDQRPRASPRARCRSRRSAPRAPGWGRAATARSAASRAIDVDRVGADGDARTRPPAPSSRGADSSVSAASAGAPSPTIRRSTCSSSGLHGGADQQHRRAGRRPRARGRRTPGARGAPRLSPVASGREQRTRESGCAAITGPRRPETTVMRVRAVLEPRRRRRSPSARIGLPLISLGHLEPVAVEDRRREVGREHEPRGPGGVRGQVPVEARARAIPIASVLALGGRRALDRDQHVVAAQARDQRGQLVRAWPARPLRRGSRRSRHVNGLVLDAPGRSVGRDQRRSRQQRVGPHPDRRRAVLAQGRREQAGDDVGRRVLGALDDHLPIAARVGRTAGPPAGRRRRAT